MLLTSCVVVGSALAAPSSHAAARFKGSTSQGLGISLRVGDDGAGEVMRANVAWRAPCHSGSAVRSKTGFVPPMDLSAPGIWRDRGGYRLEERGDSHTDVFIRIHGRRVSQSRWKGAFRVVARVCGDESADDCSTGKVRWSASRPAP
jgi:hypothetical protein